MPKKAILVFFLLLIVFGLASCRTNNNSTTENVSIIIESGEFIYSGREITPNVTVIYGDKILTDSDYSISYENNINAGDAQINIDIDCDFYAGTKKTEFKIVPRQLKRITVTFEKISYQYTGLPIIPIIKTVISKESEELGDEQIFVLNKNDYEITASNNVNIGIATITIKGINNYSGKSDFDYNIIKRDLSMLSATAYPEVFEYQKNKIFTPEIMNIKYGNEEINIIKGIDYILEYENNNSIGTATIIAKAIGDNCYSELKINFEITNDAIYHIAFRNVDGTEFFTINKKYNESIEKPDDKPIKQNKTIVWYEDKDYSIPFYFDKMPIIDNATKTMTLYGKWQDEQGLYFFDTVFPDTNIIIENREDLIMLVDYLLYSRFTSVLSTPMFYMPYCESINEMKSEINLALANRNYPAMKVSSLIEYYYGAEIGIKIYFDADESIFEPSTTTQTNSHYTQFESINNEIEVTDRAEAYDSFPINNNPQTKTPISDSNQLFYTLQYGQYPNIVPQSTAERLFEVMKNILIRIIDNKMTDYEKVKAIYTWLIDNVEYDYTLLNYKSAGADNNSYYLEGVFDDGLAVCDGIAKAFTSLCQIEGINCVRVVGVSSSNGKTENHAWNKVKINNQWYIVDATWGNTGIRFKSDNYEYLNFEHFLISDETKFSQNCTDTTYNNILCLENMVYYKTTQYPVTDKNLNADYYIENTEELFDLLYHCVIITNGELSGKTVNFYAALNYGATLSDELALARTDIYNRTKCVLPNFYWTISNTNDKIMTIIFGQ